jgi:hypothetical protein
MQINKNRLIAGRNITSAKPKPVAPMEDETKINSTPSIADNTDYVATAAPNLTRKLGGQPS